VGPRRDPRAPQTPSPASGTGQTRCRQTRLSAACGSILAQVIPRFFGPDPQAVKTIVQRETRHWIHSITVGTGYQFAVSDAHPQYEDNWILSVRTNF